MRRRTWVIMFLLAAGGVQAQGRQSAHPFDGNWSVQVITEQGECDRAYRWNIGVRNGRVAEMQDNVARASGEIARNGRVAVTFTRGADVLSATGTLRGDFGRGNWTAPSRKCAGRWDAERRG